jgi:hypothetical protein
MQVRTYVGSGQNASLFVMVLFWALPIPIVAAIDELVLCTVCLGRRQNNFCIEFETQPF